MEKKICNICKVEKTIDNFYINKKNKPEFCCRDCKSDYFKELYIKRMKDPVYVEKRRLKSLANSYNTRYGVDIELKIKKIKDLNNKCEICEKDFKNFSSAYLDHCHYTGEIRGVLCPSCNTKLSGLENKEFMKKAKNYLKKYETRN